MTESKKGSRSRHKKAPQGLLSSPTSNTSPEVGQEQQQQQQQQPQQQQQQQQRPRQQRPKQQKQQRQTTQQIQPQQQQQQQPVQQQPVQLMSINNVNQLGSGVPLVGSPKGSCFKSASTRNTGSPNKVHWEKSLLTPTFSFSSSSSSSSALSSESMKMASPMLPSPLNHLHHHPDHNHQHHSSPSSPLSSSPRPINVPNLRTTGPSTSSSSSPSTTPSAQISQIYYSRTRQSSSSSSSSSSSPTPSLSSSPSFAGAKWQSDAPLPGNVPKPPMRWLGTPAADNGDAPLREGEGSPRRRQHQQQQQRHTWQPLATRRTATAAGAAAATAGTNPAVVAAFPTQMRSGCDASEMRALMAPPGRHLPPSMSTTDIATINDADFQMRTDISNQLKALLNVVG